MTQHLSDLLDFRNGVECQKIKLMTTSKPHTNGTGDSAAGWASLSSAAPKSEGTGLELGTCAV